MKNHGMNPITEDDIANYLANTPDFFARHAELLASVQLNSPHGNRAVSLQERQAEMLREKIKALEHRLMDMVRHGNENMIIPIDSQPGQTYPLTNPDSKTYYKWQGKYTTAQYYVNNEGGYVARDVCSRSIGSEWNSVTPKVSGS